MKIFKSKDECRTLTVIISFDQMKNCYHYYVVEKIDYGNSEDGNYLIYSGYSEQELNSSLELVSEFYSQDLF